MAERASRIMRGLLTRRDVRRPKINAAAPRFRRAAGRKKSRRLYSSPMHFDAHQPVINDLEARIVTIRDSL